MAKSTRPKIRIHNSETNEIIDREMNDSEFAQYEIDKADYLLKETESQAKTAAKKAILDRLGLTADELKTILG